MFLLTFTFHWNLNEIFTADFNKIVICFDFFWVMTIRISSLTCSKLWPDTKFDWNPFIRLGRKALQRKTDDVIPETTLWISGRQNVYARNEVNIDVSTNRITLFILHIYVKGKRQKTGFSDYLRGGGELIMLCIALKRG